MALKEYRKKRVFSQTPEPTSGKPLSDQLQFVVQEHAASRLHYDFRLEMNGVLKSWAIPKGPSLNPQDKRLAMMVEDHPFDYRDFEGIIPEGNYGAGQVIVWDRGTYEPLGKKADKKEQEKELLKELKSGSLKFRLSGRKLKGEFALVHLKNNRTKGDNAWLLIKHRDAFASDSDITKKERSVLSGKTLSQVGKDRKAKEWISNKTVPVKKNAAKRVKTTDPGPAPENMQELIKKGTRSAIPKKPQPMLAFRTEKPFDGEDWIFEIKWDGYRAIATVRKGKAGIESRHNISFDKKFLQVKNALEKWGVNAVIDGEIIALAASGQADFQALQGYLKQEKPAELVYYVFDLLWYEGRDYTGLPLIERKTILQYILPAGDRIIRYSDHVLADGIDFFKAAVSKGLEGIMAKKSDSLYRQGRRSRNWLKIKNELFTEAIICGYTRGRNSREYFGALILGRYEGKELKYMGHTGSGFDQAGLKQLFAEFRGLVTDKCPFRVQPKTNMPATWLKPELVCLVKYTEATGSGSLRHPIYVGLREDKKAVDEKDERLVKMPEKKDNDKSTRAAKRPAVKKSIKVERARAASMVKASKENEPEKKSKTDKAPAGAATGASAKKEMPVRGASLLSPGENDQEIVLNKHTLSLTNLNKLYWPKEKISKGDMIRYYDRAAEYILPYLVDRPQSLNRFPNGIGGESFYQKNVGNNVPDWIKTYRYKSESDGRYKQFLVATDKASLIYMANLGCIEMNPWNSRIRKPDYPDWCVIDLDPDKTNTFNQVVEVALRIKAWLDRWKVTAYCKTSGSTGIHIYIPLAAKYTFDQSRMFAEIIVTAVQKEMPGITSIERSLSKRKGKIYLDFLQNRQIQTIAAPYSLRPKPGATVSMPLHWEEVKPGLKISDFNIRNALDRMRQDPDIFKGVLGPGINLDKILKDMGQEH